MWKLTIILSLSVVCLRGEDVRLTDLDPPEAQQIIDGKDTSLRYAPKVASSVPAVRYIGSQPQHVQEDVYLANQYHGQDGVGGYVYGYAVPDIAKAERKRAGGDLRGAYNYIGGDGQEIKVEYWDDGHGFHQIDNVPKALPTDAPEVQAAKDEHARIWAEQAERNSKPVADPYPNAGPGAYAGYGAGVGAGVPSPKLGAYQGGQQQQQQHLQQRPLAGAYHQQGAGGPQSGPQGGYQPQGQQYGAQPTNQPTQPSFGQQGTQQGGYQGQTYGGGQRRPQGQQHGAGASQGHQDYQGQQSQQQHLQQRPPQPAFGQQANQQGGYQGQTYGGGQSTPQGQHHGAGASQGHQDYQGQQSQQQHHQQRPPQPAFGQQATQQGGYQGQTYGGGQPGPHAQPQSLQGHQGQQSQQSATFANQPPPPAQQRPHQSQHRGQYGRPAGDPALQQDGEDDGAYRPEDNEGQWQDDGPTGPPKGFFYNVDYPVGIIVSKQGGAQQGASLLDTYKQNKANFDQQLQGGAAVHGAGAYPSYQVHS